MARPEKIVDIPVHSDGSSVEFDVSVFESVIKQVKDLPVFVVSITGVMRSGKSFLFNMMKLYLEYYIKVSQLSPIIQ